MSDSQNSGSGSDAGTDAGNRDTVRASTGTPAVPESATGAATGSTTDSELFTDHGRTSVADVVVSKIAGMADKAQPLCIDGAVSAPSVGLAGRLGQNPDALVIADCFDVHACLSG